jgi:hypothetical protein
MKSWAVKALETVNCFAFLKCKLTVVIRACWQLTQNRSVFFFFIFIRILEANI